MNLREAASLVLDQFLLDEGYKLDRDFGRYKYPHAYRAFHGLGMAQRSEPEDAMRRSQEAIGGGVMSDALEHIGDLTHRMSEYGGWLGTEFVLPKLRVQIGRLKNKYQPRGNCPLPSCGKSSCEGFTREHHQNLVNNAKYMKMDFIEYEKRANQSMREYADEHAKLKVYNWPQYSAREAAVALGRGDLQTSLWHLERLHRLAKNKEKYTREVSRFRVNPDGSMREYTHEDHDKSNSYEREHEGSTREFMRGLRKRSASDLRKKSAKFKPSVTPPSPVRSTVDIEDLLKLLDPV